MRKRGYSPGLAAGIIAAGGTLGILMPPSLTLILYAVVAEQSIGKLFMAGVGPGLLLTALFAIWVVYHNSGAEGTQTFRANARRGIAILRDDRYTWRETLETLPRLCALRRPASSVVMVALYGGWATPSEIAGLGAFAALLMVIARSTACWRWSDLKADPRRHGARIDHADDDHRHVAASTPT